MREWKHICVEHIDGYPRCEDYTKVTCDSFPCKNTNEDSTIYEYGIQDLCEDCLIKELLDGNFVRPSAQTYCDDCDCDDVVTYEFGSESWCRDCLLTELERNKIIKEV